MVDLEVLIDNSQESINVVELLKKQGVKFSVSLGCSSQYEYPALRTENGTIDGYAMIKAYFFPQLP